MTADNRAKKRMEARIALARSEQAAAIRRGDVQKAAEAEKRLNGLLDAYAKAAL